MTDLSLAFGNVGSAATWYLTSRKPWFIPIDISALPGPQPDFNTELDTVTVQALNVNWAGQSLYFNRVFASTTPEGFYNLDVVRFWNDVKNVQVISGAAEKMILDGFVHVDVMVGGESTGQSHIVLNGAKRGNVITGSGDDIIEVKMVSNNVSAVWQDDFRIFSEDGDDLIVFSGLDIAAELAAGDLTYSRSSDINLPLVVSGFGRNTYVDAGAGDDRVIGWDSREHIVGGADDGLAQILTTELPPSGFGYSVGGSPTKGPHDSYLYRIDLATGATTAVGALKVAGLKTGINDVEAMSLSPVDGFLYGFTKIGSATALVKIDPATGTTTIVNGALSKSLAKVQDASFGLDGKFYAAAGDDLVVVNVATGASTILGSNLFPQGVKGLAADPESGNIYALTKQGSGYNLLVIDDQTGAVLSSSKVNGFGPGSQIEGLSFDSAGKLFAVDRVSGAISSIDLATSTATLTSTSLAVSKQTGDGFEVLAIRVDADQVFAGINVVGGDVLTGGMEADHFLYRPGDGVDTITDFEMGVDALHIDGYAAEQIDIVTIGNDTYIRFKDGSADGFVDNALIKLSGVTGFGLDDLIFSDSSLFFH